MPYRQWLKTIAFAPTFWLILVFLMVSGGTAYILANDVRDQLRSKDLTAAARAQSELLSAVRSLYSRDVVDKLRDIGDVTISHDHVGNDKTIPLPATFTINLEKELKDRGSPSRIRLISDTPFPWREERELDDFERDALAYLADDPGEVFERIDHEGEYLVFRSASAVVMFESCVSCHNSHPDSPRTDWQVGDVRGIQEVTVRTSAIDTDPLIFKELIILAGIAFLCAVAITGLLLKQNRSAISTVTKLAERERAKNRKLSEVINLSEEIEARNTAIIETMDSGLLRVSMDGVIEMANSAAVEMLGAAHEDQLIGKNAEQFLPKALWGPLGETEVPLAAEGHHVRVMDKQERIAHRADHSQFPVELTVSNINIHGSHVFTAVFRDLTEQKAAAAKIAKAETTMRDAIESLPDAFVLYDSDDRLVICNHKYREFYASSADYIKEGATFEEIIRKGAENGQYQHNFPTLEDWIADRLERHQNPGEPVEQHLENGRWLRAIENRTRDGGWVGFRVDITELKKREQEIQRSGDLLRNVVSASFDGVIVMDATGAVIDFNPAAEEIFGWSAGEILGQHMSDYIIPQRYREAHDTGLKNFLETGEGPVIGQRIEIEGVRKDGEEIMVELAIRNTMTEDGPLFVGYVRDITERKAADAALRDAKEKAEIANEAKAQFLAMMSHEIRTPLNGVLGILSLLRDTSLDPKQRDYVKTARESGRSLLNLINDILDFTKLEAGRMELDTSPFSLPALVDGVIDLFMPIAREKQLTLDLEYPPGIPGNVIGDAGRIRQIVLNLVSNAIKFTEIGGVSITVTVERTLDETAEFKIAVKDTGIGIPKDKHDILFGNFVTVDTSYSRKFGGTGLGLAISDQLVKLMDGHIGFDSLPGAGSTFWFSLPLKLANSGYSLPNRRSGAAPPQLPGELKILLAEDNATNQIVVGHALENAGCKADIVNNGREALVAARARAYDCILMDVSMPEMDGIEATAHIRENSLNEKTPIVALTAYALKGDREKFLGSGMTDFLAKPVEKEELLEAILRNTGNDYLLDPLGGDRPVGARDPLASARKIIASMPEEIQTKLVHQFISDIQMRSNAAENAHQSGDLTALERATHAMKSVAGTFGAEDLASHAEKVNALARQDKQALAFAAVPDLLSSSAETLTLVSQLADNLGLDIE